MGIPAPPCSGTGIDVSVSAEPPSAPRSTCMIRCSRTPSERATHIAASSSAAWRWPYATESANNSNPRSRAQARAVAESRPPDSSTTARSAATLFAPQQLVQLDLEAHRQVVGEDPFGQLARFDLAVARRKQYPAVFAQAELCDLGPAPFIVRARSDHELDLVMAVELAQLRIEIA